MQYADNKAIYSVNFFVFNKHTCGVFFIYLRRKGGSERINRIVLTAHRA